MTAIIVGGLVVVVVLAVVLLRYRAARSDRRSMETYGHALGVLGSVAKRTGPSQSVRVLPGAEPGQAHVRTGGTGAVSPARAARPGPPAASIPVRQHVVSFDDSGEEWAGAGRPVVREPGERGAPQDRPPGSSGDGGPSDRRTSVRHEAVPAFRPQATPPGAIRRQHDQRRAEAAPPPSAADAAASDAGIVLEPPMLPSFSPEGLRRQASVRRLATGAFAALAVAAIVVAAVELSGNARTAKTVPPTSQPPPSTRAPSTTAARPTTTRPTVIEPSSTSGNDVTFQAPAGHYVLTFATSGQPCWVGVETAVGTGNFLWTQAVQPGSDATYRAAGSLVVNVGAAEYLSMSVNGVPIRIPSGVTTGYISFVAH